MRGVLLLAAAAAAALALALPQAGAIIDPTPDSTHASVGIMYLNGLPAFAGFCTGSLLSPTEFLTAGHCTAAITAYGLTPDQVSVSFDDEVSLVGDDLMIESAHPVAVTGWTTHPGFKTASSAAGPTLANDVGVVHLAVPVDLPAVELPPVGFLDAAAAQGGLHDHAFTMVGYGFNGLDRSFSSPRLNLDWEHRRMSTSSPFMSLTQEHLKLHGGGCYGDSGGPAFWDATSNLVVATNVDGDEPCKAQSTMQRLDTPAVHTFLAQYAH